MTIFNDFSQKSDSGEATSTARNLTDQQQPDQQVSSTSVIKKRGRRGGVLVKKKAAAKKAKDIKARLRTGKVIILYFFSFHKKTQIHEAKGAKETSN